MLSIACSHIEIDLIFPVLVRDDLLYVFLILDKCYPSAETKVCNNCYNAPFQDSLQKILEQLSLRLFTDHRLHEKRRLLLMYRLVCRMLLRDFDGGLGENFVYILREMIHRLVYLLQDMRKQKE